MGTLADRPKYYWDACLWIELIQGQCLTRGISCEYILIQAKQGKCEIWTSAFTMAEVFKRRCGEEDKLLQQKRDSDFDDLIEQEFIKKAQVDFDIGATARRLLRKFPKIKKPQDAVHIATCILYNLDQLHTFDNKDLLGLKGKIPKISSGFLDICLPPYPPLEDEPPPLLLGHYANDKNSN